MELLTNIELIHLKEIADLKVIHLKEIAEIKFEATEKALELQALVYTKSHSALENKIDSLQKIVYVGLGIVAAFQILLKVFVKG